MRITIEIDCKDTLTAIVHTPTGTTTYPQVAGGLAATAETPPPEVLRTAAALGATSAGPAPAEVGAAATGQALSSPATMPGVTDAGAAPAS
jgi:hypothetical protein